MAEIPLGLLGFAAGAMQAGRASPHPMGFGEAFGGALNQGVQNYGLLSQVEGNRANQQMRQMMMMQQLAQQKRQADQRAARDQYLQQYASTLPEDQRALAPLAPDAFVDALVRSAFSEPAKTSLMRELEAAGYDPQSPEYRAAILRARTPVPSAVVNMGPGETEYAKTRGKQWAEQAAEYAQGGRSAEEKLAALSTLSTALADEDLYTGTGGPAVASLKRLGGTLLGIEGIEGLGSAEVAQTIGNQMALQMRDMMPGPMSNADLQFLRSLPPNLSNSREGNILIADFYRRAAERQLEAARLAREYEQRNLRLDAGFDRVLAEYNQQNPLFDEDDFAAIREAANQAQQPSPAAGVPPDVTDILDRYLGGGN